MSENHPRGQQVTTVIEFLSHILEGGTAVLHTRAGFQKWGNKALRRMPIQAITKNINKHNFFYPPEGPV